MAKQPMLSMLLREVPTTMSDSARRVWWLLAVADAATAALPGEAGDRLAASARDSAERLIQESISRVAPTALPVIVPDTDGAQ